MLLHGWPGFWFDWRRVLPLLDGEMDLVAPDFRGFGDSDAPDLEPSEGYTPQVLAEDVLALLEHLGLDSVVIAAHDIGATVAQVLAFTTPERVRALALFDPPYPGIGDRRFDPSAQREFWYQHFHTLPWSDRLIGHDRETVAIYLRHFYDHWSGRPDGLDPREFDAIVDVYSRPGAVRGSIQYYRARASVRAREASIDPRDQQITQPTVVLWGVLDPVIPASWSDRLADYFPNSTVRLLDGVGHFVPFEAPEDAADAIREAVARSR